MQSLEKSLQKIPPTSIAAERTFSKVKYIYNEGRTQMLFENLENIMIIKCYYEIQKKM